MNPNTIGIVFDCDSTLSTIEGIDELAELAGVGEAVKELTHAAMNGEIALESVYHKRLELIRPNKALLRQIAQQYQQTLTPNAKALIQALLQKGYRLAIVSGGLQEAIEPLAQDLGIEHLFAVPISFDEHGAYAHTPNHPLTTARGKSTIIQTWREALNLSRVVMIGDGMSDVAAKPSADKVIGYGGVVVREQVRLQADEFVEEADMMQLLPIIEKLSQ
ncbi:MAG: HAD-IB family phosphatase [Cardiobacteriaceae bacterium]|nr:HAD-IB family phosphatase [Cardiobacteriaceae bacterium]